MRTRRIIINTDAKNEADDQFAIVHALLSQSLDVRGVIPAHFGSRRNTQSRQESREEVDRILDLLGKKSSVVVADGADVARMDETTPVPSAGSRLIIDEAFAREDRLFVAFLGPLTDMASALLEEPTLQYRDVVVVWIGGPPYGGTVPEYSPEFNLSNDVHAANVVVASGLTIWQIPVNVYTQVGVGYAELEARVRPHGPLGSYLTQIVIDYNTENDQVLELRSLGDSPAIGAVMNPAGATWRDYRRPRFTSDCRMIEPHAPSESSGGRDLSIDSANRTVRVCESLDTRWLLEDMFHKIAQFAR